MLESRTVSIRALSKDWAEQMAYYRWLENSSVSLSTLIESLAEHCCHQVQGRHVLAMSDTSEINLQAHAGRLKPEGLGVVGNNRDIGFFLHPTLIVDSTDGTPLGFSHVQLWTRPVERPSKAERDYKSQPIEEKESYKWIDAATRSQPCLTRGAAAQVTYIGDSESDIYEPWVQIRQTSGHLLIRACHDRQLYDQGVTLFHELSRQPSAGQYRFDVPAEPRSNRIARTAQMTVRFTTVRLKRPQRLKDDYPEQVEVQAVEAVESDPPPGQKPVHWRLLTTHPVQTKQQALQIIQWYRWRWHIEQLFAILKQRGLDIEATENESIAAIQKLSLLGLSVALQLLQLMLGREHPSASATLAFDPCQQRCLEVIAPTLNGPTAKQQNPHPTASLAWAAWIIARLGGWSGYQSQRPPGIVTFERGLQVFQGMFAGWQLAHP
jgi:hypothetical protein